MSVDRDRIVIQRPLVLVDIAIVESSGVPADFNRGVVTRNLRRIVVGIAGGIQDRFPAFLSVFTLFVKPLLDDHLRTGSVADRGRFVPRRAIAAARARFVQRV